MSDCDHNCGFLFLIVKLGDKCFSRMSLSKCEEIKEKLKETHVSKKRRGVCFCAEVMQPASLINVLGIGPSGCGIVIPGVGPTGLL